MESSKNLDESCQKSKPLSGSCKNLSLYKILQVSSLILGYLKILKNNPCKTFLVGTALSVLHRVCTLMAFATVVPQILVLHAGFCLLVAQNDNCLQKICLWAGRQ